MAYMAYRPTGHTVATQSQTEPLLNFTLAFRGIWASWGHGAFSGGFELVSLGGKQFALALT